MVMSSGGAHTPALQGLSTAYQITAAQRGPYLYSAGLVAPGQKSDAVYGVGAELMALTAPGLFSRMFVKMRGH
jgi:hypothetical protein